MSASTTAISRPCSICRDIPTKSSSGDPRNGTPDPQAVPGHGSPGQRRNLCRPHRAPLRPRHNGPRRRRRTNGRGDRRPAAPRLRPARRRAPGRPRLHRHHRAQWLRRDAARRHPVASDPAKLVWQLDRAYWGRGLAPEGAAALADYAWSQLHASEIVAITAAINHPSRRVMEKLGMAHEPTDDFLHPDIPADHPLRPHVLYRISSASPR